VISVATCPYEPGGIKLDALVATATLSAKEAEVLRLSATGYPRDRIVAVLGISENTFKVHVRHILQKTGASSMDSLTRVLLERVAGLRTLVDHDGTDGPSE
jgi:DNA-binding CsgD family transcriptional regulator